MSVQISKTVCPHDCQSVCPLEVEVLSDHKIGKVKASRENPFTAGIICAKVARYSERIHHPDRLTTALMRTGAKGSGQFRKITLDQALDEVAENLIRVEQTHGSEAVWPFYYAGTMGHVMRDGINRLAHHKNYSKMQGTYCVSLAVPGWKAGYGHQWGVDVQEMAHSEVIVIWGMNVINTQIQLMTHILKGMKNGAKLIVIDPYANKTAQKAHMHLPVRPGTDGALACAVMHVLFRDGFADRDYMKKYADDPDAFEKHLVSKTPQWASEITGVPVHSIEAFARLYGSTKKSFLRIGYGMSRTRNGAVNVHAAGCLPIVTGAWLEKGGGALFSQGGLAQLDKTLIEGLDHHDPAIRTLDQSRISEVLAGHPEVLKGGPPVHALFIQNTNPMNVAPHSNLLAKGMAREDLFTCVHEQFMTDTAEMADIVIPATMFMEHDDLYTASGHCTLQAAEPIVQAPKGCISNHDLICALAKRLGLEDESFSLSARDMVDRTLKASGYPERSELIQKTGYDLTPSFEQAHFIDGFGHPDKKFRFKANWSELGPHSQEMPAYPDHWDVIDEVSSTKPFRLITPPAQNYLNTSFTETRTSRMKERCPEVKLHPRIMRRLKVSEGELVRIGNEQGSVLLNAVSAKNQHPDTVVVESVWPSSAFLEGKGINSLTSSSPGFPNNGAVYHDTSVWVKAHFD